MERAMPSAQDAVRSGLDTLSDLGETAGEKLAAVKPKLRGYLHLGITPLALAGGIVLIALSPTTGTRVASALFTFSALLLFGCSALYHTRTWSPRAWATLRRLDHSNIFVLIAGSYTPFAVVLLEGTQRVVLLSLVWGGATLGVLFRVFWAGAPRWLYTPIYIALGWAAVFFMPGFLAGATALGSGVGVAIFVLIVAGGVLYTFGGVVYGFKRPDPWPTWFGFHEIFHVFTILAFASHYIGVSLATYALR